MDESNVSWEGIAHLWRGLSELPIHTPEASLRYALGWLEESLGANEGFANLSHLTNDDGDDLGGWRVLNSLHNNEFSTHAHFMEHMRSFDFDLKSLPTECWARGLIERAGEARVFMRQDILGETPWSQTQTWALFQAMGHSDRIMGILPIDAHVELHIGLHRGSGLPAFVASERDALGRVLPGLFALGYRWALAHGLIGDARPLSPRERQTLGGLLSQMSEKQIAAKLGVSPKSLHQYVVAIYRKFHVSSRPELMMKWMQAPEHQLTQSMT